MWVIVYNVLENTIAVASLIIRSTWFIVVPVFLFSFLKPIWRDWRSKLFQAKLTRILLEITLPPDVKKTPKAMESVLIGLHGVHADIDWRDHWWKGESQPDFSLEMVGNAGRLRFFIQCQARHRNLVESKIYAEYPDAEVHEVADYMHDLPDEVPSDEWDIWAAEYILTRKGEENWVYPIRTYVDWEDPEEERRIDPISQLAETAAKMSDHEYAVVQIVIAPALTEIKGKAQAEVDRLMKRTSAEKPSPSIIGEIFNFFGDMFAVLGGSSLVEREKEEHEEAVDFGALRLSEGERDMIKAIDRKAGKISFWTMMRSVYLYRKDHAHREHIAGLTGFLRMFANEAVNSPRPASGTFPSSSIFFFNKARNRRRKKREYTAFRGRKDDYILDEPGRGPYVLCVEELASIFHLPGRIVAAPSLSRQESRSGEPPFNLPK